MKKQTQNFLKDFDQWNTEKKKTHANEDYFPLYSEREIRWCQLGVNVGFEQDGTGKSFSRPVLILKVYSRRVCLIIPLTTSTKRNIYHVSIGNVDGKNAAVIISQLRLIDTRRLDQHITTVNKKNFEQIKKAVKRML